MYNKINKVRDVLFQSPNIDKMSSSMTENIDKSTHDVALWK